MLHNNDTVYKLYCDISRFILYDTVNNLQDLQKRLRQEQEINLHDRCGDQTLGEGVLELAVKYDDLRVVKFLLQNVHTEQSKLKPESELYKLYQQLKDKALATAIDEDKPEIVQLFKEFEEVKNTPNGGSIDKQFDISNGAQPKKNNEAKENDNESTKAKENVFYALNKAEPQKNNSKDFYVSLGKDGVGVIATVSLVAASIMVSSAILMIAFNALAVFVAIGTGLHIKNSTVPSYREMQENKVERASLDLGV